MSTGRLLFTLAAWLHFHVCLCSVCFSSGFYGRLRVNERALYAVKKEAEYKMVLLGKAIISLSCLRVYPILLGNAVCILNVNFTLILCSS